jgi:hypothetical protein
MFEVGNLSDRDWHNIVYQWDGTSTASAYVDGVLAASTTKQTSVFSNAVPFRIGGNTYSTLYFPGQIDDVSISTEKRSPGWISAQYRAGRGTLLTPGSAQTIA